MSHNHYTTSRRMMSMTELTAAKNLNKRLEAHLRTIAHITHDDRYLSQAERVHYCSTYWQGQYCPECGKYHDMHTTGCKHRLCPICATRIARVTAIQAVEAIAHIQHTTPDIVMDLVTLTQRNVAGEELNNEINAMLRGWYEVCNSKTFRKRVHGWARTIEIVPALANDGTYHPHIHTIVVYRNDKDNLDINWFRRHWQSAMRLDYDPVCDVRPITDAQGAVFEVSKYISKLSRIYDESANEMQHIYHMSQAMYNRRLRSYGGAWRHARQQLGQIEAEAMPEDAIDEYGTITDLTGHCPSCGSGTVAVALEWSGLRYIVVNSSSYLLDNIEISCTPPNPRDLLGN